MHPRLVRAQGRIQDRRLVRVELAHAGPADVCVLVIADERGRAVFLGPLLEVD